MTKTLEQRFGRSWLKQYVPRVEEIMWDEEGALLLTGPCSISFAEEVAASLWGLDPEDVMATLHRLRKCPDQWQTFRLYEVPEDGALVGSFWGIIVQ